jgi:hypothetical protein
MQHTWRQQECESILFIKPRVKGSIGRPTGRLDDNIRMNLITE